MNKQTSSTSNTFNQTKNSPVSATSFNVLGFVPALVIQHFLKTSKKPRSFPESQQFKSVVMFADISGFTILTESLSKIGAEGAELISIAINRYMELLVKGISRSGGDIFKFAGDAMIVLWPPPEGDIINERESLQNLLRQAIQSAMDIQGTLDDTIILDKIKLSVKIGFGIGDINIIYVGGVFSRCEYIATGDPLTQAFESEHHANKGGQTIISRDIFKMVEEFFEFEEIKEYDPKYKSVNGPFYYVKDFKHSKVRMKADALIIKTNLTANGFDMIKSQIMSYIPAALIPYIDNDQESWSAELRRLSIMFVNLGIDLIHAKTIEGLNQIQKVIETVQKCVYYHQGSVNKLLMDDKGSTLIVVFGFSPISHQDDPIRAILTGFSLIKELGILNCKCSIGISTGTVFAGVIGTSGSRREYSVLGDSVNISARLMQQACSESTKKIICCENTATSAQHKILMKYYKMINLKGKEKEIAIYEPTMMTAENLDILTKEELFSHVMTHQNSFILNDATLVDFQMKDFEIQKSFNMVGRNKELHQMNLICEQFMQGIETNGFILIRGTYGIGKSLFIRVALRRIKKEEHKYSKEKSLTVLVSSLGPITKTLKANGFRQILQQIFKQICKRMKCEPNQQLFLDLIPQKEVSDENYELFQEFLEIKQNRWIDHFPTTQSQQIFVEGRAEAEMKQITQMTLMLFKHYTKNQPSQIIEKTDSLVSQLSLLSSVNEITQSETNLHHPMIIVLEDLNLYCALSLHLIRQVILNFQRVLFVSTVRDQYVEIVYSGRKDGKEKKQGLDDIFKNGLELIENALEPQCFHTLNIRGLHRDRVTDELKLLIKQQFNIASFALEKEKQTPSFAHPQEDTMKSIDEKLDDHLIFSENKPWLWQKGISYVFYQYVYLRTNGNPLTVTQMIQNLLRTRFIMRSEKDQTIGIITEQFRQVLDNEETITIDAPQCWVQVNGPIIDKLGCLEVLLMKTASVIGDIFDLQTLNKVQSFKDQIPIEKLMKILADLEAQEFLEILEISDHNIFYRFTHPFMRETIYQRMTYTQRRGIHRSVAEAIQTMSHGFEQEEGRERKRLEFHWIQAEQLQNLSQNVGNAHNEKFSYKAKRSIIVKQIQQILSRSPNMDAIIRYGLLDKKSDKNISWAPRFVVITSREFKYYYRQQDMITDKEALGIIQLKDIYSLSITSSADSNNKKWSFSISSSAWVKKHTPMTQRHFFFATSNEDLLEEWSIFLEFAKAKAIYDEFVFNFGRIQFPIGQTQENLDQTIRIDISNKLQRLNFRWNNDITQQSNMRRNSRRNSRLQVQKGTEDPLSLMVEISNIKNFLKLFLEKSTMLFYSQLFEMCMQENEDSYKTFGQNIKIVRKKKHLFEIKPTDLYFLRQDSKSVSQLIRIRTDTIQIHDFQQQQLSDSDSDVASLKNQDDENNEQIQISEVSTTQNLAVPLAIKALVAPPTHIKRTQAEQIDQVKKEKSQEYISNKQTQETENYQTEDHHQNMEHKINITKPIKRGIKINQQVSISDRISEIMNSEKSSNNQSIGYQIQLENQTFESQSTNQEKVKIKFLSKKPEQVEQAKVTKVKIDIIDLNKKSLLEIEGIAVKSCCSLKGQQFFLQKGEVVIIKKIYQETNYLKCIYRGSQTGIMRKSDLSYDLPKELLLDVGVQKAEKLSKKPKVVISYQKHQKDQEFDEIFAGLKQQPNQGIITQKYQY